MSNVHRLHRSKFQLLATSTAFRELAKYALFASLVALAGCASTAPRTNVVPKASAAAQAAPVRHGGVPLRPLQASAATAAPAFPAGLPPETADKTSMVAHFIDVGQGDATLLEFSCGAVLIDTGGEKTPDVSGQERLSTYLQAFFQRRSDLAWTLDLVVLSHPHIDHTDGVNALLNVSPAITVRNVVDNGETKKGSGIVGQKKLQQFASDSQAHYEGITAAEIKTTAGLTDAVIDPIDCSQGGGVDPAIVALWGRLDPSIAGADNANNDSVVIRVDFGRASFLFMGDLEVQAIGQMLDSYADDLSALDVDVLKVGHHGSKNGTTAGLVSAVTPRIAVIQAGDSTLSHEAFSAYSFGHPNKVAVDLLLDKKSGVTETRPAKTVRVGIRGKNPSTGEGPRFTSMTIDRAIYATGWDGNVAVIANKNGELAVETEF